MKKRTVILLLSATVLLIVVAVGVFGYYHSKTSTTSSSVAASTGVVPDSLAWKFPTSFIKLPVTGVGVPTSSAYSSVRASGGIPSGLPIRLEIPIIGVDSFIEDAFITPEGAMEVPAGTVDVAWFALGAYPGQVGSAVIGGHFGIEGGVPFVFYNLSKLRVGDKIYIVNDYGNTLTFVVSSTALFAANADATNVFTSSDGLVHLNLITCEGLWNEVAGEYPDRTVVFATEITSTATAPATVLSASAFTRSLGVGDSGVDVSALQTALEQRKFLTMPPGVATGYFGSLTSAAVSDYQTSVGLPANGTFGVLTRASLITNLATDSVLPYTGLATVVSLNFYQLLVQYAENLYATPLNGLVTSLLIIAIGFMIFMMVRRRKNK